MTELLQETSKRFQQTELSESTGICYLTGHILTEYFKSIGYNARKVTGKLCLVNTKGKYVTYGRTKIKKSEMVGYYHTWCEVEMNGEIWIIDPSIKANKRYLKNNCNIKLDKGINDTIITNSQNTYKWKYIEDERLSPLSESWLSSIPRELIENILQDLKGGQKAA